MSNNRTISPVQLVTFGNALYKRRMFLGRSQAEIRQKAGVSGATVGRWESADSLPHASNIAPLAIALEWTMREFMAETDLDLKVARVAQVAQAEPVWVEAPKENSSLTMRSTPRYAWLLGQPSYKGGAVRGADLSFQVTLYAPVDDRDTIELAWMESLLETAEKFAVNMPHALVDMLTKNPDWEAVNGWPVAIEPEL